MCQNNKSCITISCGCCGNNTEGGKTVFKETVLYDGLINTVGTYDLTDDISNYDDVCIVHQDPADGYRQCLTIPVIALGEKQMVCHGNGTGNYYVNFNFKNTKLNIASVTNSYEIVKIIGRKY